MLKEGGVVKRILAFSTDLKSVALGDGSTVYQLSTFPIRNESVASLLKVLTNYLSKKILLQCRLIK